MEYTLENIIKRYNSKEKLDFLFFYGHYQKGEIITKSCLSQWYDCAFEVDGRTYSTAEQYMMAQKAFLFDDVDIYHQILKANNPKDCKELGRKVQGFSPRIWDRDKYAIVVKGNMAKFSQNKKLLDFLLSTNNKILVEASPYDRIWGIGLKADTSNIENPYNWKGQNLLGFALMQVRGSLKN